MWHKYLPLATFAHNMFNSPNLANHSPYELMFGRKMTLDGKLLRGLFEHERLKPAVIRMNQGNVTNLAKLKQVMSSRLLLP